MQTFKHKTIPNYYFSMQENSSEWLSGNSISFNNFDLLPPLADYWEQCSEFEYIRVRENTMRFLNEMRPPVMGASKYLNKTINPLTAE